MEKGAALELLCRLFFIDGSNPARDNHKAFDHRISRRPRGALTAELFVYDASNAFVFALSALEAGREGCALIGSSDFPVDDEMMTKNTVFLNSIADFIGIGNRLGPTKKDMGIFGRHFLPLL